MLATQSEAIEHQQTQLTGQNSTTFPMSLPPENSAGLSRYIRQVTPWRSSQSTKTYRIICDTM